MSRGPWIGNGISVAPAGVATSGPNALQTSVATYAVAAKYASVQAVVAGGTAIVATLVLSGSNDVQPEGMTLGTGLYQPQDWTQIASAGFNGTAGNIMIPTILVAYRWLQVSWVVTSGSGGTVSAVLNLRD